MLKLYQADQDYVGPREIDLTFYHNYMWIGRRSTSSSQNGEIVEINLKKSGSQIISRKHAKILYLHNLKSEIEHCIQDCGAMNGLFVNGNNISSHLLQHNDIVQFLNIQLDSFD